MDNILKAFNVEGEKNSHDAGADAYNTMLGLKQMLKMVDLTFSELIEACSYKPDQNKDYIVKSLQEKKQKILRGLNKTYIQMVLMMF